MKKIFFKIYIFLLQEEILKNTVYHLLKKQKSKMIKKINKKKLKIYQKKFNLKISNKMIRFLIKFLKIKIIN